MKFLVDENLSRRLAEVLADVLPESTHVTKVGLERASKPKVIRFGLGTHRPATSNTSSDVTATISWLLRPTRPSFSPSASLWWALGRPAWYVS